MDEQMFEAITAIKDKMRWHEISETIGYRGALSGLRSMYSKEMADRRLKATGHKGRPKTTGLIIEQIAEYAEDGLTISDIAEKMNCGYDYVRFLAKRNGIKINKKIRQSGWTFKESYEHESLLYGIDEDVKRLINGKWKA